jgi:hypothetical protein
MCNGNSFHTIESYLQQANMKASGSQNCNMFKESAGQVGLSVTF